MKRSLALLVVIFGLVGLTGCSNDGVGLDQDIIGTWRNTNAVFYPYFKATFNVDGTVVFTDSKSGKFSGTGVWYTEGDILTVSLSSGTGSVQYRYTQSGDSLTLRVLDGFVIDFIRVL